MAVPDALSWWEGGVKGEGGSGGGGGGGGGSGGVERERGGEGKWVRRVACL